MTTAINDLHQTVPEQYKQNNLALADATSYGTSG